MNLQEIDVFIEKDGRVRLEVRGVKGEGCLRLTQELEKALGGELLKREMTPEASQSEQAGEQQWQWGGSGGG